VLTRGRMWCEWPTWALIATVTVFWMLTTAFADQIGVWTATLLLIPLITLHSSLQHETVHILEPRWPLLSRIAVFPAIGLLIPYMRFRDLHLAHHHNEMLTDPYDDPESNYLDPATWDRLPGAVRAVLKANNTLLGRMVLGPALGQGLFLLAEWRAFRAGTPGVAGAWAAHLACSAAILGLVAASPMPVWAYLIACYIGLSILKIRTFLEHQAHDRARGRTVIIEDRGPLAFLFLNNNLHVVHHMHPKLPWYRLPRIYFNNRARYLTRNDGYCYASYGEIFRKHLIRAKDPVAHPLYPQK